MGKDTATGGFFKRVGDIGVEALDDSPPLVYADVDDVSKKKQVDPSHVISNEIRSHRKRSHATIIEDVVYQDLSIQLGKVASAIEKISENQLNFDSVYEDGWVWGKYACVCIWPFEWGWKTSKVIHVEKWQAP